MKDYILNNIDISNVDYISGGERRDWFFSIILSYLLNKLHISIYKDLSTIVSTSNFEKSKVPFDIKGKKVLHIADLITVASSYLKTWIPAIKNLGGTMCWSFVAVDRMQGGKDNLEAENVKSLSLVNVDISLFETAYKNKVIGKEQLNMLESFYKNPDNTMKQFLIDHPDFLKTTLQSGDEKTVKRAKLLINENLYGIF